MCQLQQKHFLRQDSNLTHPFHLVSGYHKSRIFVSAMRIIIHSLLNNSKAISVPKMNKIFFHSFQLVSFHFILTLFYFMLTSGGISWLSPGSDYFISCQYPAASQRSVPGLTISFLHFRCHSLLVIFGV